MARLNIIRCDRCNVEIKNNKTNQIVKSPQSTYLMSDTLDFCDGCIKQFERFLNNADVGSGDTTFEEFETPCTHYVPCAGPCGPTVLKRVHL